MAQLALKYLAFVKAQAVALIATGVDFLVTLVAVAYIQLPVMVGTVSGTIAGGTVNFLLGRNWVFYARQEQVTVQLAKFILIWLGNLALNAGGVYVLVYKLGVHYIPAKIIVAVVVGVSYNYLLQMKFVFRK